VCSTRMAARSIDGDEEVAEVIALVRLNDERLTG
jgi:hypothetical protein